MTLNHTILVAIKHQLIAARTATQHASAQAQRAGDTLFAERLRKLADQLGYELNYVEARLAPLP